MFKSCINLCTCYQKTPNPDREAENKYYESLILARRARLREEQCNDYSNKKKIKELVETLAEYKQKYEKAKKKIQIFSETFQTKKQKLDELIDSSYKKLDQMKEEQNAVEYKIGLRGTSLLECLISVQIYSRQIKNGATAYSPFVSILNGKLITQSVSVL